MSEEKTEYDTERRIEVNGITYVAKKEKKKHACTGCDLFTWERRCWAGEAPMCNGIIWKKVKELDKHTMTFPYVAKKEKKKHACTGCDLFTWERRCWAGEAFSEEMINALIAGSKTMTRRIARQDKYGNLEPKVTLMKDMTITAMGRLIKEAFDCDISNVALCQPSLDSQLSIKFDYNLGWGKQDFHKNFRDGILSLIKTPWSIKEQP